MPSLIAKCYYRVCDKPSNPRAFQNVSTQYHNTTLLNFELKLRVRFIQRCSQNFTHVIHIPSPLSSHYISMKEFFLNGSSFLRRNLFHRFLKPDVLDILIPNIINLARRWYCDNHRCPSRFENGFVVIPLCIELVVELHENVNLVDIVDHTADDIRMTQTFEVNLLQEDNEDPNEKNECCICLEDLFDNIEISKMPCQHVFHHNCIIKWLKTSHLCPLCRYPMPVEVEIM